MHWLYCTLVPHSWNLQTKSKRFFLTCNTCTYLYTLQKTWLGWWQSSHFTLPAERRHILQEVGERIGFHKIYQPTFKSHFWNMCRNCSFVFKGWGSISRDSNKTWQQTTIHIYTFYFTYTSSVCSATASPVVLPHALFLASGPALISNRWRDFRECFLMCECFFFKKASNKGL